MLEYSRYLEVNSAEAKLQSFRFMQHPGHKITTAYQVFREHTAARVGENRDVNTLSLL